MGDRVYAAERIVKKRVRRVSEIVRRAPTKCKELC